MRDLAPRIRGRVQLTTDGHKAYLEGVYAGFGQDIDYAMLVKLYGPEPSGPETRYSPPKCIGARAEVKQGNPDPDHISTPTSSGRTSTCGWGCAGSRGSRTRSQRSARTTNTVKVVVGHFTAARPVKCLDGRGIVGSCRPAGSAPATPSSSPS